MPHHREWGILVCPFVRVARQKVRARALTTSLEMSLKANVTLRVKVNYVPSVEQIQFCLKFNRCWLLNSIGFHFYGTLFIKLNN